MAAKRKVKVKKTAKYYRENPEARAQKAKYDTAYHSTQNGANIGASWPRPDAKRASWARVVRICRTRNQENWSERTPQPTARVKAQAVVLVASNSSV